MESIPRRSKLYLIGAGPGDPELLTVKGARVLGECDVILYDRLVNHAILSYTRSDAERIYVGKREGEQDPVQARIFSLIREHGDAGKVVGRLKGGDPFIFARGGEEWHVAAQLGMDVEYVPGVTSAIAIPGLAAIPLTYRESSQSFAIITGHQDEPHLSPWARYRDVDTLVILMGVKSRRFIARELIDAGRAASEPIAFIANGSRPEQHVVIGTLASLAAGEVEIESPAVLIVGEVVRQREKLMAISRVPTP